MHTFLIAEACDNHMGSLENAFKMVDLAKLAGADAIKFQHHLPDQEMLRDVPTSENFNIPLYEFLIKHALKLDEHILIKEYCDKKNIEYMCTPFSLKAAEEINNLVNRFKIGSGELTDTPTLIEISKFNKPMILSTGMSKFEEIDNTYNILIERNVKLSFLNCVSEYPPIYEDLNLKVIQKLIDKYHKAKIGHSDHSPRIETSIAAVALGAEIIEKHVTLDKGMPCPDQSVSIDFNEFSNLVESIRNVELALGDRKIIHKKEESIRAWAHRSLVTIKDIQKGEILTTENIWGKRPGTGIPSSKMEKYLGRKVNSFIPINTIIKEEMICK